MDLPSSHGLVLSLWMGGQLLPMRRKCNFETLWNRPVLQVPCCAFIVQGPDDQMDSQRDVRGQGRGRREGGGAEHHCHGCLGFE